MKIENNKLIPECLNDISIINHFKMKKWLAEIKTLADGDKNEEIRLKMALLKSIEYDDKSNMATIKEN